jgi:hypothetical protein
MRSTVDVNVPHTTALSREDHFVFVLDDVYAAGVGVEQDCTVTASWIRAARPFHHNVRHTRRVRPDCRWQSAASDIGASAACATGAATSRTFRRELGLRQRRAEATEAA